MIQPISQNHLVSLAPGAQLGPYEVHLLLESGGMGEVSRAKDTKLNRDVALKVQGRTTS
jgi:serine/threonine protein kinase